MHRTLSGALAASMLLLCARPAAAVPGGDAVGTVTIPLSEWAALRAGLAAADIPALPPATVLHVDREVDGAFRKGVFSGTLTARVQVLTDGPVRVPVIDADATIGGVLLDGRPTSLLQEGALYTVGVEGAGQHTLRVDFLQGREDDRFARRLHLDLPPSGPTRVSVDVPEPDIDATLTAGVLTDARPIAGGTRLAGHLDARGDLELSWTRRLAHDAALGPARTEARVDALFTLHEALVRGVAVVDLSVLEGEVDRLDLIVPPEVEVVDVTGDAVLQWRTEAPPEPGQEARLGVLLRYLVSDSAKVQVHFQLPVEVDETGAPQAVALAVPRPADATLVDGSLGVQGPAGLDATIASMEHATELTLRDLPPQLTELTDSPLLLGMAFQEAPSVTLALARHGELELTSTIVDDIEASTVLLQDGAEITKLRMRLRNNTRQYLKATLPPGAVLTHAFVDGEPIRPGLSPQGDLLLPLRQSERVGAAATTVTVQSGQTLGGIAAMVLGDASRWPEILSANSDRLGSAWDLEPGMVLRIPTQSATVRESTFVIELAWRTPGEPLGLAGRRTVTLPALDVDAVAATWHVYTPEAVAPVHFSANLSQVSAIKYDPFRRAKQYLQRAMWSHSAWAGGYDSEYGGYTSILSQRKAIYRQEQNRLKGGQEVMSDFPFTGDRHRFRRILLGRETPRVQVTFIDRDALPPLRWGALLASFGLVGLALRRRDATGGVALFAGMLALLFVGHHVLGVHRRVLWGADLALLWSLVRVAGPAFRARVSARFASPRASLDLLSWRNLAATITLAWGLLWLGAFPMLLSSAAFVALLGLNLLALRRA
ncbi:MAG: LysM peptidoglycan-binding domain-containing protein [Alphaproteobacteria bacterium]|nr:LysM peptidoglycan-binding domain-containing protein [Alphaproteobacteria bacterium]